MVDLAQWALLPYRFHKEFWESVSGYLLWLNRFVAHGEYRDYDASVKCRKCGRILEPFTGEGV